MSLTKTSYSMITGSPVNVIDFGADSTGTSDSTLAIQAAINSIATAGCVYFPTGTYNVNATINTNNKEIVFIGNNSAINLTASASYVFNVTNASCEFKDFFISKNSGVTASAFFVTGVRHIFNNIQSFNCLWSVFFYCQDMKESHFCYLDIQNDTTGFTGNIFELNYSVNNTLNDSFLGFCNIAIWSTTTSHPIYGYKSEGFLVSNIIAVYSNYGAKIDQGTLFSFSNCCFDFCSIEGIFQSNGNNLKVFNTWIAGNANNFIAVGTLNVVDNIVIVGNTFVCSTVGLTNCVGVSISGTNAIVNSNVFQSGMNGGTVTNSTSQVFGNSIESPGTDLISSATITNIQGNLNVKNSLTVSGNNGIFPSSLSGSATAGTNGALPLQVAGYAVVTLSGVSYKIPYYNI